MTRLLGLAAGLALLAAGARAAEFTQDSVGLGADQFLLFGPGARPLAMGEAYTAVANDATATFWNPAGLMLIPKASLVVMHGIYVADITYDHISYAQRLDKLSVIGGAAQVMDAGTIPQLGPAQEDLGTFHPRDQLYTLSYARDLDMVAWGQDAFSFGVSLKYLHSQIVDTANTYTFDVGVMSRGRGIGDRPLRIGFAANNMAGGLKYDHYTEQLPMVIKGGASIELLPGVLVAADAVFPRFGAVYGAAGLELALNPGGGVGLDIRGGVNSQGFSNLSGLGGLSFGGGIRMAFLRFDYAYIPMGELGNTQRFSISFDLPGEVKTVEPSLIDIQRKLMEP
jgi:hypothetical protein